MLLHRRQVVIPVVGRQQAELLLHQRHGAVLLVLVQVRRLRVGEAHRADLALLDQLLQLAHGLLHRPAPADIVHHDQVKVVQVHPLQRILHIPADRPGAGVVHHGGAVPLVVEVATLAPPVQRALGLDQELVPAALERLAQQLLTQAGAVDRGGVDVVDAEVDGLIQQALHLADADIHIRPDTAAADAPGPKGDHRGGEIGFSEFLVFHKKIPSCDRIFVDFSIPYRPRPCTGRIFTPGQQKSPRPGRRLFHWCSQFMTGFRRAASRIRSGRT